MNWCIACINPHNVVDEQEFDSVHGINLRCRVLAQNQSKHRKIPGVFGRIFAPRAACQSGLPNGATVGRNTLVAGGINNFDVTMTKSLRIGETRRVELRWEALNTFNHPQFTQIPSAAVAGTPGPQAGLPSRFLNRDYTDSGIRSMWVQAKFVF